jgi:hypothetical protein
MIYSPGIPRYARRGKEFASGGKGLRATAFGFNTGHAQFGDSGQAEQHSAMKPNTIPGRR